MSRRTSKTLAPAPAPIPPTAEEIARRAAHDAAIASAEAYVAAKMQTARQFAERLYPGRVFDHYNNDGFCVMFGANDHRGLSMSGPGQVELLVEVSWFKFRASDALAGRVPQTTLRPRAYSLDSNGDIAACEAQGRAMIEAAGFGRAVLALLDDDKPTGPVPDAG